MFAKATSRIYAAIPNAKPFSVNRRLVKRIRNANSLLILIKYPEALKNEITLISWALPWQVGLFAAICLFAKATSRIYAAIPNAK
ncbi:hypothetical protein QO206_16525, partial [Leeuwenhoekiella aequorea]|uniref:hypothetical protein n=1 Tax=Leeuwenhoekiella aequorea TaxID=283736 RepID=UPI00352E1BDB